MKKKFLVELIKVKQYHIEAEDMDEAENIAFELDASKAAAIEWANQPYDDIGVEED